MKGGWKEVMKLHETLIKLSRAGQICGQRTSGTGNVDMNQSRVWLGVVWFQVRLLFLKTYLCTSNAAWPSHACSVACSITCHALSGISFSWLLQLQIASLLVPYDPV